MHVDYLTLACLRDRLDGLLGARVQRVVLPDDLSVGLELYAGQRHQLLISADPQHPRMLRVPQKLRRGVETATPLLQLLRKWVRGGRLIDITQPPWERILVLHFDSQVGRCRLVAELIGRYSNVILVGPEGQVLEATKRIGPDRNRYRVTLPAHPYQPPPVPPGRRPPTQVSVDGWAGILAEADPDDALHRLLTKRLLGVSPTAGREIATRAAGDPRALAHAASPEAVATAVTDLFALVQEGAWAPHVALGEEGEVAAFTPYEPHQFERTEPTQDISEAMWRYFGQRLTTDSYAAARQAVEKQIDQAQDRVERALEQLEKEVVEQEEIDGLREAGELLLSYQGRVERGAREVTLPDMTGQPRRIPLDPALSPVENAQDYFQRYRKAKRAAKEIPARRAALKADRLYLDQLSTDLALAESRPEIEAVREGLADAGWAKRKRRRGGQVEGPRRFEAEGVPIYVGRNARQNEEVTFQRGGPEDLWLHVRGLPGAHVIVKREGEEVPERVIQRAAELAAYYSSARGEKKVGVDVTERRFVQRIGGERPGLVTYRNERTIWAEPRLTREEGEV